MATPPPIPPATPPTPSQPVTVGTMSLKTQEINQKGRRLVLTGTTLVLALGAAVIAFALVYPFNPTTPRPLTAGVDLTLILAPIIAASTGIERLLETLFDLLESYQRAFVAFLAGRSEWLRWAVDEWKAARERLDALAQQADPTQRVEQLLMSTEDALTQRVERAADDLARAEQRLASLTETPQYRDAKRVISILLSLFLGIVVATVLPLQMFALLGVNIPARLDVLITGIAIGTGATPVHMLIGILQQGKDTLDGAQQFLKTRSAQIKANMS